MACLDPMVTSGKLGSQGFYWILITSAGDLVGTPLNRTGFLWESTEFLWDTHSYNHTVVVAKTGKMP